MSENENIDNHPGRDQMDVDIGDLTEPPGDLASIGGSVKNIKLPTSSTERQIKYERAQKCLENAALVSKRIKEHRKATAELLGKPFDEDVGDTASEMASTMSERTGYSVTSEKTTLSVQDALNIPGISESLANTLKQKELLMERIKHYKEISKRPAKKSTPMIIKDPVITTDYGTSEVKKQTPDNADVPKLVSMVKEKENALSVMQVKMRAMETTILDLQEKINEKDQIIDAKNKATTLISDNLSKKEKDSMALLEDTRQQMIKMQSNFAAMEAEWKEEKNRLLKQIDEKNEKINNLQEANTILENSRFEIGLSNSKLAEELELKNKEILELQEKIKDLSETNVQVSVQHKNEENVEEEKGTLEISEMVELTKKIEILEQLNFQIRQTNKELENQLATITSESKPTATTISSSSKKGSPVTNRKGGRNIKSKSPWRNLSSETLQDPERKTAKSDNSKIEMMLQSLNKDILEKEYLISQKDLLISQLESANIEKDATIAELRSCVDSKMKSPVQMVDVGTENIDSISRDYLCKNDVHIESSPEDTSTMNIKQLEERLKVAQAQIVTLNEEIDSANKNMVKVKSHSKLKFKQLQKTIDSFSKVSDANAEIVRLNDELHQLSQKVAELEEEKGNLQLHLVDYDSGRLTESDVYKKLVEIENLAEARLKSITLLETQKFDLVQELHVLQQKNIDLEDKLADMSQLQSEHVCSEIKSVQLEEQIDELIASKKELELVIQNLKLDMEQSLGSIKLLQAEKDELIHKLDNYIQENMELTDKLEKLSAEKVSSAESIEIVESLTTQEKLELEEYNKGLDKEKRSGEDSHENYQLDLRKNEENIQRLEKQSAELNEKVEMFTNERQEVMAKMISISSENESLHDKIELLNSQCEKLRENINLLTEEKTCLQTLNLELNQQIEELKLERLEIMKETVEVVKPGSSLDDNVDLLMESHDEKSAGDKINNRSKSVKQLTKEILKLKNTIKEREAEIADCQMKILSLEENQEKQKELLQNSISYEEKLRQMLDENNQLKQEIDRINELQQERKNANDQHIQEGMQKLQQEYSLAISSRDTRIHELDNLLKEYEMQILNYVNTLQQKDKEINEYVNQITKLNDVSQKLKSTIELLEEEKAKDQNVELIKSLNKQISIYQKTLSEYEEKLKTLDEEKSQLSSLKALYENKNNALEADLKKMEESIKDKETIINDLKCQQQKHSEELSVVKTQAKQQDEEIHEIKLQLRKESIENEKLRTSLQQKDDEFIELKNSYEQFKAKIDASIIEHKNFSEQYAALENKNKELLEKLKKFAVNLKKKTTMYTDLENQFNDLQKEAESKSLELELLHKEKEMINILQEQLKKAEIQLGLLANEKSRMQEEITKLQNQLSEKSAEVHKLSGSVDMLTQSLDVLNKDFYFATDENANLKTQIESYKKKIAENEIEQKNNSNLLTKISCLEADINIKQSYIEELSSELKNQEDKFNQIQLGHEAKVQECELYIENLQAELEKYKNRIGRLEEAVSMMEESRNSLEHKADQLENQLQEKRQAYIQYSDQEDELVSRLAYLMDYDRVIEKQLYEIDMENQELQFKIQYLNEENTQLQNTYSDLQDYCKILELKAHKIDAMESDASTLESRAKDLESYVKKLTNENQTLMEAKKREMDELESEFNTQIENAIKEKKLLNEKCEKLCEREAQLLTQINEYHSNLESLKMNLKELSVENQKLLEKSTQKTNESVPDYTDQYISEINNLNSIINSKNEEIIDLSNKIQSLQSNNSFSLRDLDTQISKLTHDVQSSSDQINKYVAEIQSLKIANEDLSSRLVQKDDQIKQLLEKKKMFFEMNIPKTDGLTISSTIEDISDDQNISSISDLQSQIVTDTGEDYFDNASMSKETLEGLQSQQVCQASSSGEGVIEPLVVPKKSYLCYTKDEEKPEELDPFNSEEGWGVDVNEDTTDITPGVFHLNQKIQSLLEENQKLKSDLENTNAKLLKALKKLKELKSSNDMLTNELKISKQISQASILDMAIESEMNSNLEELEKKIQELKDDLNKEKREKESLRKQNEVFKNANDRLMEMKEKMDNEVELWKYNFKQINDKMSSLQWGAESKDYTNLQTSSSFPSIKCAERDDDIIKLEKENDELQTMLDNMNLQNTDLSKQLAQLKDELSYVKKELDTRQSVCEQCEKLKLELQELQSVKTDLHNQNMTLNKQSQEYRNQIEDAVKNINELKCSNEKQQQEFQQNERDLQKTILDLHETLKQHECDALQKITSMNEELESVKLKLQTNDILSNEHASFEQKCISLRNELQNANEKITILESRNDDLTKKIHENDILVEDLNNTIKNLHYENDQLLSTVAELRASVSSAVDQRGYEIAELWKQHLNQREGEFQKIEEELRTQLKESDSKYEQLLDKMQSANKEDTDKIIVEQVMSLQNKIQEKEENLISLQGKYSDAICQLEMLRSEMEDEKLLHENKMLNSSAAQQKMYEELMNEVNLRNQKLLEEIENITQAHKAEISSNKLIIDNLNQQIEELRKSYEITVADLTKQIQIKEAEIYQKTNEFTNALAQRTEEFEVVRSQLLQYEKKIEDLEFEKESELAVLRLKIHDTVDSYERKKSKLEEEKNSLAEELNSKIVECTNLNKMVTDLKASLEEYSVKAAEAQAVLENQEIEIVSLKEEISNLSDILKASNSKIEKHVTFATDTKPGFEGDKIESTVNKELLDAVPRAELDLALYMLHQRDVRCEELTMELTQLLEERDTLQLRLSDSLRSVEELRMKANLNLNISGEDIVSELPSTSLDKEHLMVDTHRPQTSRSSSISEHDVEKPKLQAKLSELRSVKHSRDVRLRHESESRQLGMRLLHRDVANLPPEAVDQLAQAHHTLTRDSQSTPTVLLNWLRGKSTPKVVHM